MSSGASAASRHAATTLVFYERSRSIANTSLHYLEMQMNQ